MSVVLWPRQEVLQLVIPQLGLTGRILSNTSAIAVVRQLAKYQSIEGKISFDRWLIVAKDTLRWNDNCIQLFWEMLCTAVYYLNRDPQLYSDRSNFHIELDFVAIFLVLHVNDGAQQSKSSTPNAAYDTAWPSLPTENELLPLSPVSSPSKDPNRRKFPNIGSPRSPRSPRQTQSPKTPTSSSPTSAKRAFVNGSRTPRTTSYLHSVRQKIPIILRALGMEQEALQDSDVGPAPPTTPERDGTGGTSPSGLLDFAVNKRTIDALGLIVCGGHSREEHISELSQLHPHWSAESDPHLASSLRNKEDGEYVSGGSGSQFNSPSTMSYSELTAWFNLHLSMNDILYPSIAPSYAVSGGAEDGIESNFTAKSFQPSRTLTAISSLTRFVPTVISHCSTTVMHVITSGPSRAPSFRRINSVRSQDNSFLHSESVQNYSRLNSQQCLNDIVEAESSSSGTSSNHSRPELTLRHHITGVEPALNTNDSDGDAMSDGGSEQSKIDTNGSDKYGITLSATEEHSPLYFGASQLQQQTSTRMDDDDSNSVSSSHPVDDADLSKFDLSNDIRFRETFLSGEDGNQGPVSGMWSGNVFSNSSSNMMQHPELTLPQLFLSECKKSQLYLISPYYSASVTGCEDCEIVIGAVFGAVIVNGCERVKITASCRKLVVLNCLECEFHVATMSPTVLAGDCRGLTFGPHNASYRNLKNHLKLADLQPLAAATATGSEHKTESLSNCWASLCDVNACLDALPTSSSPAGYALDAMTESGVSLLPMPPSSTAEIESASRFQTVIVPFKQEFLAQEFSAVGLPSEYTDSMTHQHEQLNRAKAHIANILGDITSNLGGSVSEEERRETKAVASAAISKKFMEWLLASDHAHEILDLVRMDSERSVSNNHYQ